MHLKSILATLLCLAVLVQSVPVPAGQYIKYRVSNKYFDKYNSGNSLQSKDPIYELLSRVHNDKIPHVDATLIETNEIVDQKAVIESVKPVLSQVQPSQHSGGNIIVEVISYLPTSDNHEVVKELVEQIVETNEQPEGNFEMESAEVEQGTEKIDKKTTPTDYEGEVLASEEMEQEKIEKIKPEDLNEIDDKISSLVNLATEKEPEVEQSTEQIKPIINEPGHQELENSLSTVYNLFKGNQQEVLEAVEHSTQISDSVLEESLNKIYGLFKEVVIKTEDLVTNEPEDNSDQKDHFVEEIPSIIPTVQTPVEQETQKNYQEDSPVTESYVEKDFHFIIPTVQTPVEQESQEVSTEQLEDFGVTTEFENEEYSTESIQDNDADSDEEIVNDEITTHQSDHQIVTEQVDYLDASTDESIVHHHETTQQPNNEEKIIDEEIDHSNPKPVEPIFEPITGELIKDEEIDHSIIDPEPITEQPGIEIQDAELAPEVKEFLDTKVDFQDPENFNYKFQFFDDTKIFTYVVRPRGLVNILDGEPKYTVYELDVKPMKATA